MCLAGVPSAAQLETRKEGPLRGLSFAVYGWLPYPNSRATSLGSGFATAGAATTGAGAWCAEKTPFARLIETRLWELGARIFCDGNTLDRGQSMYRKRRYKIGKKLAELGQGPISTTAGKSSSDSERAANRARAAASDGRPSTGETVGDARTYGRHVGDSDTADTAATAAAAAAAAGAAAVVAEDSSGDGFGRVGVNRGGLVGGAASESRLTVVARQKTLWDSFELADFAAWLERVAVWRSLEAVALQRRTKFPLQRIPDKTSAVVGEQLFPGATASRAPAQPSSEEDSRNDLLRELENLTTTLRRQETALVRGIGRASSVARSTKSTWPAKAAIVAPMLPGQVVSSSADVDAWASFEEPVFDWGREAVGDATITSPVTPARRHDRAFRRDDDYLGDDEETVLDERLEGNVLATNLKNKARSGEVVSALGGEKETSEKVVQNSESFSATSKEETALLYAKVLTNLVRFRKALMLPALHASIAIPLALVICLGELALLPGTQVYENEVTNGATESGAFFLSYLVRPLALPAGFYLAGFGLIPLVCSFDWNLIAMGRLLRWWALMQVRFLGTFTVTLFALHYIQMAAGLERSWVLVLINFCVGQQMAGIFIAKDFGCVGYLQAGDPEFLERATLVWFKRLLFDEQEVARGVAEGAEKDRPGIGGPSVAWTVVEAGEGAGSPGLPPHANIIDDTRADRPLSMNRKNENPGLPDSRPSTEGQEPPQRDSGPPQGPQKTQPEPVGQTTPKIHASESSEPGPREAADPGGSSSQSSGTGSTLTRSWTTMSQSTAFIACARFRMRCNGSDRR